MFSEDTIAAIATPIGYGGISVIRISGKDAFEITDKIFKAKKGKSIYDIASGTINYGHIISPIDKEVIDEVLVSKMKAPHTYTTENVIEINTHGGISVTKKILTLILANGARLAESGEFTKRAFLGGRIDLVQAEAVSDIITAKTETFAKTAVDSLGGKLSEKIDEIKDDITNMLARIEVTIQYPEYDVEDYTEDEITNLLSSIKNKLDKILKTFDKGQILKDGMKVAIIGKPNVGKSMLLNSLIDENKAIVTDEAGTTRDVVDELINIRGIPVKLFDTAGIRQASSKVEKIGIEKSKETLAKAELILFVIDGSDKLTEEDLKIEKILPDNTKVIVIINKNDLAHNQETIKHFAKYQSIPVSALEGSGIDKLEDAIYSFASENEDDTLTDVVLSNARHKVLLEKALENIDSAMNSVQLGIDIDLTEIDINLALDNLGEITGEKTSEDIIDEIFKNFCLGK